MNKNEGHSDVDKQVLDQERDENGILRPWILEIGSKYNPQTDQDEPELVAETAAIRLTVADIEVPEGVLSEGVRAIYAIEEGAIHLLSEDGMPDLQTQLSMDRVMIRRRVPTGYGLEQAWEASSLPLYEWSPWQPIEN